MRITLRMLSFAVGMGIFFWCLSHAGGFNPDGSRADPNPPPFYLIFSAAAAAVLLWLYAFGVFHVLSAPLHIVGGAAERPADPSRAPEPAAGATTNGESSPPAQ